MNGRTWNCPTEGCDRELIKGKDNKLVCLVCKRRYDVILRDEDGYEIMPELVEEIEESKKR